MKILPVILIISFSVLSSAVTVTSDFDRGSLDTLIEISPDRFEGTTKHWLKADSIGDQRYWFYFRMDGTAGKTITVKLNDLVGVYRGAPHDIYTDYTRPVYSYDNRTWGRVEYAEETDADSGFLFIQTCTSDSVWFAYAHPYPLAYKDRLVASLAGNQYVTVDSIGASVQNRPIHMLTITDTGVEDAGKKVAVVTALQHPGEDAAGYFMEGMVEFLVSDDPAAAQARQSFIYMVFPAMNPDGLYNGISRYNWNMEDLNTEWDDGLTDTVNTVMEPEVQAVVDWAAAWKTAGKGVDVMYDVHNHTQFYMENRWLCVPDEVADLHAVMDVYWPITYIRTGGDGRPRIHFYDEFGSLGITVELTQGQVYPGQFLTPEDYRTWGGYTVQGTFDYYFPDASPPQVADPDISPDGGSYGAPQQVTLTCATADARLHYTLDGTEPDLLSMRYFTPVTVPATATLKVKAFRGGYTASNTVSASFSVQGGLAAYWDFNAPEAYAAFDVQSGIRADMVGAVRVEGKFGQGIEFRGDDYLLIPPDGRLDFGSGDFTYACWFKGTGQSMDLWDGGVGGSGFAYFWIRLQNSTTTHKNLCRIDDGSASVQATPDGPALLDSTWHHLAFTRADSIIHLYIDGQEKESVDASGIGSLNNVRWRYIGRTVYADVPDSYSEGIIDEVRLYSKALGISEVTDLYNRVVNEPPVVVNTPSGYVQLGEMYSDTLKVFDPDYDVLVYSIIDPQPGMMIDENGWFTWDPGTAGIETVFVSVKDKYNAYVEYPWIIRVNGSPEVVAVPDTEISLGETFSYAIQAADPNTDDSLVFTTSAGPAALTIDGTGLITWTPDTPGTVSVSVRVEDMYGGADSTTFSIAVRDTFTTGIHDVSDADPEFLPEIGPDGLLSVYSRADGRLTLYGRDGSTVWSTFIRAGKNRIELPRHFSYGILYYHLSSGKTRRIGKLMVMP